MGHVSNEGITGSQVFYCEGWKPLLKAKKIGVENWAEYDLRYDSLCDLCKEALTEYDHTED